MSSAIQILGNVLGYVVGMVLKYVYSEIHSIAIGSKEDLIMSFFSLVMIYIVFKILMRLLRFLKSFLKAMLRLLIIAGVVWSGVYIYLYGVPGYQKMVLSVGRQFWNSYENELQSTVSFYKLFFAQIEPKYGIQNPPVHEAVEQGHVPVYNTYSFYQNRY